jgi:hypothetical protein
MDEQSRRAVLRLPSIDDARCSDAQFIVDRGTELLVYENGKAFPFKVGRIFLVRAPRNEKRGGHAHKQCHQVMVCIAGSCEIRVDDGAASKTVQLDRPTVALHVPPLLWAEQIYRAADTTLMVLCDQLYDEADYIRDPDLFRRFRAERGQG